MRIRPCIDIHNGAVKQIVGMSAEDAGGVRENFVSREGAAYYASIYREKGLSGGHVILLNGAGDPFYDADVREALSALRAFPGGLDAGGGITPENAEKFLGAGAAHVIVTSYVFRDGQLDEERLSAMVSAVGKERLVLDLSCRRGGESGEYYIVTDRWQKMTQLAVTQETLEVLSSSCDEFLIHAADVEGKRSGIEEDLVDMLGSWQRRSGFPVTYAGGVHSLDDLKLIGKLSGGAMDVTVGSALSLFGGNLTLEELVRSAQEI